VFALDGVSSKRRPRSLLYTSVCRASNKIPLIVNLVDLEH
jgi:hypothetical protein